MAEADVCPEPPSGKPPSTAVWGSWLGSECVLTHSLSVSAKAMNSYSQSATAFDLESAALCDKAVSTLPLKERPQVQGFARVA